MHVDYSSLISAEVAQSVEHTTENRSVGGSIPPLGTILFLSTTGKIEVRLSSLMNVYVHLLTVC